MAERFAGSHLAALLIGLAGGIGLTWSWHVRAETRLVRQADSLTVEVGTLNDVLQHQRATDTLRIVQQRTVVREQTQRTDTLVQELFTAAPDTLKPLVEALAGAVERERIARDSLSALLTARIAFWRDTALTRMTAQRDQAMRLLDAVLRKNRRCGIGASGPFSVNTKGAGWGAALGVSCRL